MSDTNGGFERLEELEKNVEASKNLIADLHKKLAKASSEFEREKLEVNIEDATKQLKAWEYELHLLTAGKE